MQGDRANTMKDKDKDRVPLPQRICRALDIPTEILPSTPTVEIHGYGQVKISGGGAILLYSPCEIRIAHRTGEGYMSIRGEGLSCSSYNMGAVGIEGRIRSVSFEEEISE